MGAPFRVLVALAAVTAALVVAVPTGSALDDQGGYCDVEYRSCAGGGSGGVGGGGGAPPVRPIDLQLKGYVCKWTNLWSQTCTRLDPYDVWVCDFENLWDFMWNDWVCRDVG
jgi:hypothetical protein